MKKKWSIHYYKTQCNVNKKHLTITNIQKYNRNIIHQKRFKVFTVDNIPLGLLPFSECLKDDTVVDETLLYDRLIHQAAVTALFENENNSGSVYN